MRESTFYLVDIHKEKNLESWRVSEGADLKLQRFRFPDWQGTIRAESNASTRVFTESLAFAPFGERYALKGAPYNVDSFTGKPDQLVSDEYDFPAREEHNAQGRWVSPDPMRGTGNKYVYADNNPLSKVDIYGLLSIYINGIDYGAPDAEITGSKFNPFEQSESHAPASTQTGGQPAPAQTSGNGSSSSTQTPAAQQQAQTNQSQQAAQNTNASAVPLVLPVAPTLDVGKIVTTAVGAVAGAVTSTTAAVVGVLGYLVSPGTSNVCTCSTDQPQVGTPASTSQQGAVNNGPIESRSNPLTGKPGDTTTLRNPDGTVRQVRGYGPDGYPKTDVDHGHDQWGW